MTFHLASGDSLATRLREAGHGQVVAFHEAMIVGPRPLDPAAEAWEQPRAEWLAAEYAVAGEQALETQRALSKSLAGVPRTGLICWFGDDVFCVCNLLAALFRVRAQVDSVDLLLLPNDELPAGAFDEPAVHVVRLGRHELDRAVELWLGLAQPNAVDVLDRLKDLPAALQPLERALRLEVERIERPQHLAAVMTHTLARLAPTRFDELFRQWQVDHSAWGLSDYQVWSVLNRAAAMPAPGLPHIQISGVAPGPLALVDGSFREAELDVH